LEYTPARTAPGPYPFEIGSIGYSVAGGFQFYQGRSFAGYLLCELPIGVTRMTLDPRSTPFFSGQLSTSDNRVDVRQSYLGVDLGLGFDTIVPTGQSSPLGWNLRHKAAGPLIGFRLGYRWRFGTREWEQVDPERELGNSPSANVHGAYVRMSVGFETTTETVKSCSEACGAVANADRYCNAGACGFRCSPGFGDCDRKHSNGCEARLDSKLHCGGCDVRCGRIAHGYSTCGRSRCVLERCEPGYANCDLSLVNGCETELANDARHCGACGRRCGTGEVCTRGRCGPSPVDP
jgi:hypothetical protein